MGFFGKLFGKDDAQDGQAGSGAGQSGGAQPVASNQMQKFYQRAARTNFDWDNGSARALVNEILTAIAPSFGNAMVKEVPDDENIDLRGTFAGSPVRFAIWMSFGTFWAIQMKCANGFAMLEIERDHEKIPKGKDEQDPWSENEERRVFIGKGIFFEGDDDEISAKLASWGAMPESLRARILHDMEAMDINTIRTTHDQVSLHQKPGLGDLPDAQAYMHGCAALMATLRDFITQASSPVQPGPGAASPAWLHRLTCSFCASLFVLNEAQSRCPNCGAAPQA